MVFFFNFPYHFSKNQDVQIKSKDRQNLEDGRSFVFSYFPQDSWISMSLGSIQILSKKTKIIKIDKYSSRSFDLPKKMASSIDEFSTQFVKNLEIVLLGAQPVSQLQVLFSHSWNGHPRKKCWLKTNARKVKRLRHTQVPLTKKKWKIPCAVGGLHCQPSVIKHD